MTRLSVAVFLVGALLPAWATAEEAAESVPHAVKVARTTAIPSCTLFVDAAAPKAATERRASPKRIAAAVEAAQPGAVICVAEGTYAEQLAPGEKYFTLAGGFQRGKTSRCATWRNTSARRRERADRSCASRIPVPRRD